MNQIDILGVMPKNLNIASIEKIAASKLYTILKYRIKSRDFYDIKYIMKYYDFSFGDIFDLMKKHYGSVNFSQDLIIKRFLKMPLNIDDEGFESLELQKQETFKTLRNFFKNEIQKLNDQKMEVFHLSQEDIAKNINKKYGLLRESLLMELYNINNHSIIYDFNLVEIGCDILYKDINGKTIFHLACDNMQLFEYLLFNMQEIPENIKTICENSGNHQAIELLKLHRSINRCLDKDDEKIKKIVENKDINLEDFYQALNRKKAIFKIV